MVKRLLIIGSLTGAAHISTVFVLKRLTGYVPLTSVRMIGELDSVFNFIISVLAAGLLMTSVRDIAISENWRERYQQAQQARFTLSIFLCLPAMFGFFTPQYFFLVSAPIFALNGDYALYGKGQPVAASMLAFLRVFIPASAMFICSFYRPSEVITAFAAGTIIMYFISGIIISRMLKTPYVFMPALNSLKLYMKSLYLGIVSFGYYFLGLGMIFLTGFLFPETVVALTYIALKIYVIYKGILRIVLQSFISEMVDDEVCKKVDHLTTISGIALLVSTTVFPNGFLNLLVDKKIGGEFDWIFLIGITGFLISPFISLTTKAMLEKKDRAYAILTFIAIGLSFIVCLVLSFFNKSEKTMLISLGIGELVSIAGLIIILKKTSIIPERLLFIAKNLPLLIIPLSIRFIWEDNTYALILFLLIYLVSSLLANRKQFRIV